MRTRRICKTTLTEHVASGATGDHGRCVQNYLKANPMSSEAAAIDQQEEPPLLVQWTGEVHRTQAQWVGPFLPAWAPILAVARRGSSPTTLIRVVFPSWGPCPWASLAPQPKETK